MNLHEQLKATYWSVSDLMSVVLQTDESELAKIDPHRHQDIATMAERLATISRIIRDAKLGAPSHPLPPGSYEEDIRIAN